ncbi:ABC transporter ATP-binding protein [Pararhodobacter sp.]|uniref:ABC transporter ATP-binding protein n=1 Tax=Pararhodobacter sp. TaxID=2127056 RepID=UPI002FDEAF98
MLEVSDIGKRFGGVAALSGVSLSCAQGELIGLIGPNGAGKSTLVNVISGFLKPDTGRIRVDGAEVAGNDAMAGVRAGIARTFQTSRLFGDMSVRQNVEVAHSRCLELRRSQGAAIDPDALLAECGLTHEADTLAATLAYGSQRLLEIARALALAPAYLLLDEPAAGLNDAETAALAGRIAEIRQKHGCGIVVIDHDLSFINTLCERLVVMDHGKVIASGPPAVIWKDPQVIEIYVGASPPTTPAAAPAVSGNTNRTH